MHPGAWDDIHTRGQRVSGIAVVIPGDPFDRVAWDILIIGAHDDVPAAEPT